MDEIEEMLAYADFRQGPMTALRYLGYAPYSIFRYFLAPDIGEN